MSKLTSLRRFLRRVCAHGQTPGRHPVLYGVLAVVLALSAVRGYSRFFSHHGSDLSIYMDAAGTVLDGGSPLSVPGYLYLPVFAVLLAPLAALPPALGALLWQLASWLAIVWSARAVARLVDQEGRYPWLPWFCLLATFRLLDSNLSYGQANAFTFAALMKALLFVRAHKPAGAGMLVGMAAAFKILPAALLGVFLLERRWRSLATGIAVFAAFATFLPLAVLGPDLALEAHLDWYTQVVRPYQVGGSTLFETFHYVPGQSLTPIVYHTLSDTQVSNNDPTMRANLVSWTPDFVHGIVRGLVLLHLAVFALLVGRKRPRRDTDDLIVHAALAICTVLLAAPLVHRAQMLWIMLPMALLASRIARSAAPETYLRASLALSLGLIGLTSSALIGKLASRWMMAHGVVWLAVEILWITLVVTLVRRGPRFGLEPREPVPEPSG